MIETQERAAVNLSFGNVSSDIARSVEGFCVRGVIGLFQPLVM